MNPLTKLRELGVRSDHAYLAGFVSIGISLGSWMLSRVKKDAKGQHGQSQLGLFIGEWAPTLFAIGVGLKLEEGSSKK